MKAKRVCIIGAGAAGLAAIKICREFQLDCVCYEQQDHIGGTWYYEESPKAYSAMYRDLLTNIPAEVMQYSDLPFHTKDMYATRQETMNYLQQYATTFQLQRYIQFHTRVTHVDRQADKQYVVKISQLRADGSTDESVAEFDAVMVANGHFTHTIMPAIDGLLEHKALNSQQQPTHIIHSHDYRQPDEYSNQDVLIIGASHSGVDIANQVMQQAESVSISRHQTAAHDAVAAQVSKVIAHKAGVPNLLHKCKTVPIVSHIDSDGAIVFKDSELDGATYPAHHYDTIICCTGYKYVFPFIEQSSTLRVTTTDNRVHPLYQHLYHADIADGTFALMCIPFKIVPFCLSELQSVWVCSVIIEKLQLPSPKEMHHQIQQRYKQLEEQHMPVRKTHQENMVEYSLSIIDELDRDEHRQYQYIGLDSRGIRRRKR